MGLTSLDHFDETVAVNERNYVRYRTELDSITGVSLLAFDEAERNNYQYVVLELDPADCLLSRDDLVRVLHAENVIARRYFYPGVHRMEPYRSLYAGLVLAATEAIADRVVVLPTGQAVDEAAVRTISNLIRLAVGNADKLPRPLPPFRSPASPTIRPSDQHVLSSDGGARFSIGPYGDTIGLPLMSEMTSADFQSGGVGDRNAPRAARSLKCLGVSPPTRTPEAAERR